MKLVVVVVLFVGATALAPANGLVQFSSVTPGNLTNAVGGLHDSIKGKWSKLASDKNRNFHQLSTNPSCGACWGMEEKMASVANECNEAADALNDALDSNLETASKVMCESQCLTELHKFPKDKFCCFGDYEEEMHVTMLYCRKPNKKYCSHELENDAMISACISNNDKDNCAKTDLSCKYDSEIERCAFNPTEESLNKLCSPCFKAFIGTLPGLKDEYIAVHETFCAKEDGKFCLPKLAKLNFKLPNALSKDNLDAICDKNDLSTRRCMNRVAVGSAEALRRHSMKCANIKDTAKCLKGVLFTFITAWSLEATMSNVCATDAKANNCYSMFSSLDTECVKKQMNDGDSTCADGCESKIKSLFTTIGCCGHVFANGAFTLPSDKLRSLIDNQMMSIGTINRIKIPHAAPPSTPFKPESVIKEGPFYRLERCAPGITNKCDAKMEKVRFVMGLRLDFDELQADPETVAAIKRAAIVDAALALGVVTNMILDVDIKKYDYKEPGTLLFLSVESDDPTLLESAKKSLLARFKDRDLDMPFVKSEAVANCKDCIPNPSNNIVIGLRSIPPGTKASSDVQFEGSTLETDEGASSGAAFIGNVVIVAVTTFIVLVAIK